MAIPTYEGVVTAQGNGTSATPNIATIDGGSAPTVGDLILVHITRAGVSATAEEFIDAPAGYHHVDSSHNNLVDAVFWKNWESGDDTTPTFSWSSGADYIVSVHCIRGHDQARPIVRHSVNRYVDNNFVWLSETTPVADCLALAVSSVDGNRSGSTATSGWTERVDVEEGGFPAPGGLGQWAMTQGFASASSSTGDATMSIGGFGIGTNTSRMIIIQEAQTETPRDVRVKTGSSNSPTSTGNQDITGLGFDVKALIVYCANVNSDSVTADLEYMRGIGADDGVTTAAQRSAGIWHDSGTDTDYGYSDNGSIIKMHFAGSTTLGSPDLQATFSRITDGFRLNWTAVQGSGVTFNWIAIGGDDVEAVVGAEQASTSPVSGLPWRPDLVHTLSQCLLTDDNQIRDIGLFSSGWLDCQAGAQWANMIDIELGADQFIVREAAFIGQAYAGGLTWAASFSQTASDGWSWDGTNADYFWYLALFYGNDTAFPVQVEMLRADPAGSSGDDQTFPSFADGQTFGEKQLIHMICGDGTNATGTGEGQVSEGHVEFDGGSGFVRDQDVLANAKNGTTSERNRKPSDILLCASDGDLNSPGKVGRFIDEDTVDWSTNSRGGYIIGLATIGFIGQEYERSASDTVAVTDAVAVEMTYARSASDAVAVTDQLQAATNYVRTAADTIEVTDAVAVEMTYGRVVSDSVSVADAVAREATFERSATDTISVADQVVVDFTQGGANVEIDDAIAVTDAVAAEATFERTAADAIAVADQVTAEMTFERTATDAVAVADAIAREHDASRTVSDAVSVVDQVASEMTFERSLSDNVAVTDAVAEEATGARSISDQIEVTDALATEADYDRTLSDTVDVTDALTAEMTLERAAADAVAVADALAVEVTYGRAASDVIEVTDALAREHDTSRVINDTVDVTDALATEADHNRTVNDAVTVADAVQVARELDRTASDAVDVTDALAVEVWYARTVDDAITVADQAIGAIEVEGEASDTIAVADALTVEVTYGREASDAVDVTDVLTREATFDRAANDAIDVNDQVQADIGFVEEVADTIAVTDTLAVEVWYARTISDAIDVTDTVTIGEAVQEVSASDAVDVADQLQVEMTYGRAASDVIEVTDALTREADYSRTVSDSIETIDQSTGQAITLDVKISDSIEVVDQVAAGLVNGKTVSDSIAIVDAVNAEVVLGGSASDAVEVTDAVTVQLISGATEEIEVTDLLQVEVAYSRTVNDAVVTEDQILTGDPALVLHSIDDGRTTGPANVFTVSPTGPLTMSGEPDCVTAPVGFVVNLSDHVECTDRVRVGLVCEVLISDSVEVVG